ncbi:flavonoid 3',5'-hydroxylase 1-like [Dorcoceras hygrometricum]|uniref:Flavonoid 3',5'-hydroxylase 1-like n=1 Tax=Dorcoceras hygrometricum TaxID=472368 RepID=A0A2Z7CUC8_9LAMI|nr:flavonoid 3',5'-hydroxylase 1-like [Dorcoceras hygrometricum]
MENRLDVRKLRAFDTCCFSNPYCLSYPISFDCRRFMSSFGARLVALGSFFQYLSFGTTLDPWVDLSSGCDVVEAFEHFRDFRSIVLLCRLSFWVSLG